MTWTDRHGVTHQVVKIDDVLRTTLYEPVAKAARRANESQREIARQMSLAGVEVKPIEVEEPDPPDFRLACSGFAWISTQKVDVPPRQVTCLECLAAGDDDLLTPATLLKGIP